MNRVVVDPTTLNTLGNLHEPSELCDAAGRVLGYFTPAAGKSQYAGVQSPTPPEELARRSREGGGRTLREIVADLEHPS